LRGKVWTFARDDLPYGDWLLSGAGFDWQCFEDVWEGVAREIAAGSDTGSSLDAGHAYVSSTEPVGAQ